MEFVLVLWDKDRRRVAIRPIAKKDPRAYVLSRAKGSTMFSAKSFLDHIGYDFSETRSFPATWNQDDHLLEIEIPKEHLKGNIQALGKWVPRDDILEPPDTTPPPADPVPE